MTTADSIIIIGLRIKIRITQDWWIADDRKNIRSLQPHKCLFYCTKTSELRRDAVKMYASATVVNL